MSRKASPHYERVKQEDYENDIELEDELKKTSAEGATTADPRNAGIITRDRSITDSPLGRDIKDILVNGRLQELNELYRPEYLERLYLKSLNYFSEELIEFRDKCFELARLQNVEHSLLGAVKKTLENQDRPLSATRDVILGCQVQDDFAARPDHKPHAPAEMREEIIKQAVNGLDNWFMKVCEPFFIPEVEGCPAVLTRPQLALAPGALGNITLAQALAVLQEINPFSAARKEQTQDKVTEMVDKTLDEVLTYLTKNKTKAKQLNAVGKAIKKINKKLGILEKVTLAYQQVETRARQVNALILKIQRQASSEESDLLDLLHVLIDDGPSYQGSVLHFMLDDAKHGEASKDTILQRQLIFIEKIREERPELFFCFDSEGRTPLRLGMGSKSQELRKTIAEIVFPYLNKIVWMTPAEWKNHDKLPTMFLRVKKVIDALEDYNISKLERSRIWQYFAFITVKPETRRSELIEILEQLYSAIEHVEIYKLFDVGYKSNKKADRGLLGRSRLHDTVGRLLGQLQELIEKDDEFDKQIRSLQEVRYPSLREAIIAEKDEEMAKEIAKKDKEMAEKMAEKDKEMADAIAQKDIEIAQNKALIAQLLQGKELSPEVLAQLLQGKELSSGISSHGMFPSPAASVGRSSKNEQAESEASTAPEFKEHEKGPKDAVASPSR
jgi:hypothetical protein